MITPLDATALAAAGVVAGVVGTAGAITSLVSYPALLAVGLPARPANVANIVALTCCWPGAALASQPELTGRARWLRVKLPVAALGGAAGAALLLTTPAGVFVAVVPFLVAAGALVLLLQPWLIRRLPRSRSGWRRAWLPGGLLVISLYSGYFGAGSGVMLLGLLLIGVEDDLPNANALKNMLLGSATGVSACSLVLFAPVEWDAAVPLAVGLFAGSMLGPRLTRRIQPSMLRVLIALIGVGLAIQLWVSHGT